MSDFVTQCRQEWKRLGVPDPLADEMAEDLTSDLREAASEGVSPEELLGTSASNPRSFAASWASERGVIPAKPTRRRPRILVAFTALAAITLAVAALLLLTGQPKVALVTSNTTPPHLQSPPAAPSATPVPGQHLRRVLPGNPSGPVEWILLLLSLVALAFAAWLWSNWSHSRPPTPTT